MPETIPSAVKILASLLFVVVRDIKKSLHFKDPVLTFTSSVFRPNLFYDIAFKNLMTDPFENLQSFIYEAMGENWEDEPQNFKMVGFFQLKRSCGIIYCRKRSDCEDVADTLSKKFGLVTKAYHAGLRNDERNQIQEEWTTGVIPVIAATISFGMGVDKSTVRFISHWSPPQSIAAYYQESGRAGRDGKPAFCRIYYGKEDSGAIKFLLHNALKKKRRFGKSGPGPGVKRQRAIEDFNKVVTYCEHGVCRHKVFADYFGDEPPDCVKQCDYCSNPKAVDKKNLQFQNACSSNYKSTKDKGPSDFDGHYDRDLYGGGRMGAKSDTQMMYADDTSDSYEKSAKQNLQDIIKDEFHKRHQDSECEKSSKNKKPGKNCKLIQPSCTKVSGLKFVQRENIFISIKELLCSNHTQHHENSTLTILYQDMLAKAAAKLEYEIFTTKTNVIMYKKDISKLMKEIKDDTNECILHRGLKPKEVKIPAATSESSCDFDKSNEPDGILMENSPSTGEIIDDNSHNRFNGNVSASASCSNGNVSASASCSNVDDERPCETKLLMESGTESKMVIPSKVPVINYFFENNCDEVKDKRKSEDLTPDVEERDCFKRLKTSDNHSNIFSVDSLEDSVPNKKFNEKNVSKKVNFSDKDNVYLIDSRNSERRKSRDRNLFRKNKIQVIESSEQLNSDRLCIDNSTNEINPVPQPTPTDVSIDNDIPPSDGKYYYERNRQLEKHINSRKIFSSHESSQNYNAEIEKHSTQKMDSNNKRKISDDSEMNRNELHIAVNLVKKYLDPQYQEKKMTKDSYKSACKQISHYLVKSRKVNDANAKREVNRMLDEEEKVNKLVESF
ncbi:ATP-dependent DNA helicase Q5 [Nymphon striatum]|nr:ATP-dependent DNA helicase Q5 [Nymphon striatum]